MLFLDHKSDSFHSGIVLKFECDFISGGLWLNVLLGSDLKGLKN